MSQTLIRGSLILLLVQGLSAVKPNGQEMISKSVQDRLLSQPDDLDVAIAAINESGETVFRLNASKIMPTASAIKTAILVELFAKYDHDLSCSPSEITELLRTPDHPALAPFSEDSRSKIVDTFSGVSIKRLGKIMIDSKYNSEKNNYGNAVYNAATNVAIALLGGPKQTSKAIHQRDASFRDITVNRYMLADRDATGDNTATPMALASFYQTISGNKLDGISTEALNEIREILFSLDYPNDAKLYRKGGSLHSDPVTSVAAGWFQDGERTISFAIMCVQPQHAIDSGKSQYKELAKLKQQIFTDLESVFLNP